MSFLDVGTPISTIGMVGKIIAGIVLVIVLIIAGNAMYEAFNFDKILGWVGIESKSSLKEKVKDEKQKKEEAIAANAENGRVGDATNAVHAAGTQAVTNLSDTERKNQAASDGVVKKKDKAISIFRQKPKTPGMSDEVEISKIRIQAIWDAYCINHSDKTCSPENQVF